MDDKVYTNETIPDVAFPGQSSQTVTDTSQAGTATTPGKNSTIPQQNLPQMMQAQELLSTALNTRTKKIIQEFQFTPSGALQIGDFENGISGDIRISPEGIVARNNLGDITFAIDGDTGDAIFKGKIQAGTVISEGELDGGSISINHNFTVDSDGHVALGNPNASYANLKPPALLTVYNDGGQVLGKIDAADAADFHFELINILTGSNFIYIQDIINRTHAELIDSNNYIFVISDDGTAIATDTSIGLTLYGDLGCDPSQYPNGVVFGVDEVAGKHRLLVRFATGASQVVATEP